jgi:hypothetical protein
MALLFSSCVGAFAQGQSAQRMAESSQDLPLTRGTNEFGVWAGYSPQSWQLIGTSEDRQLALINLQYARTLFARRFVTMKYTAEVVPMALEIQPTQAYSFITSKKIYNFVNKPAVVYGAGSSPVGFQLNFGPAHIQPFMNGSVGFLYFQQQVPVLYSSQFNYTVTVGFGAQIFSHNGRSLSFGYKYHHLSNREQGELNPGIDSNLIFAEFSIFHKK